MNIFAGIMIPFIGTTAGAACVFFLKNALRPRVQKAFLGFASGVMVAASVWSLLIPSMNMSQDMGKLAFVPASIGFLLGIGFLLVLDAVIPHLHMDTDEPEGPRGSWKKSTMLVLAVTLHNIPEGMAVGVAFAGLMSQNSTITMAGALALSVGIAIQNFPEGAIISLPLKEAVDFILNEGVNTRYPVYGEDIDDIIGILHMRDAMTFAEKEENKDRMVMDIPGLLREANFIPETRNIDTLFKEMQSRKIHMEIVVDEYGQTAGLLTMEDILEEIVGNIMDEYDEEEDFIQAMEDGTFVMSGLTPLEDVMETLDIELPEEDSDTYDTLNGYLVSRLDRIPQEGENPQVEFGGWLFEVERAGNKMIESVRVVPVPESGKAADRGKDSVEEKYDAVNREYEGDVS